MFLRNVRQSIVLMAISAPCIAMDNNFDDVIKKIRTGEFREQEKKMKEERLLKAKMEDEKLIIHRFNSQICPKEPRSLPLDMYTYWQSLIHDAIINGYEIFLALLGTHIENNDFIKCMIEDISYSKEMKYPLTQLSEKHPVFKKYYTKTFFQD
jgi:hypothetical protein